MALSKTVEIIWQLREQLQCHTSYHEGMSGLLEVETARIEPNNLNSLGFGIVAGLNDSVETGLLQVAFGGWPDDSIDAVEAVHLVEALVRGNVWRTDGKKRTKWEIDINGKVEMATQLEGWRGLLGGSKYGGRYQYEPYGIGLERWTFNW